MITTKKKSKPKLKSLTWFKECAWKLFSEYVRRNHADADGYSRCYTCGVAAHYKQLQCGHCIPGRTNAVLLDESICRPQCLCCNVFKHGMLHIFSTKLQLENGEEWWLKKLGNSNQNVKINRSDYQEIIDELKYKIAALSN